MLHLRIYSKVCRFSFYQLRSCQNSIIKKINMLIILPRITDPLMNNIFSDIQEASIKVQQNLVFIQVLENIFQ